MEHIFNLDRTKGVISVLIYFILLFARFQAGHFKISPSHTTVDIFTWWYAEGRMVVVRTI